LKEVIGPDVEKLLRYKKEKEKREALEAERRRRFEKMHPNVKQEKPPEEEQVEEIKPKEIYQDESGRIRDEKGNVINLKVSFHRNFLNYSSPPILLLSKLISTKQRKNVSRNY